MLPFINLSLNEVSTEAPKRGSASRAGSPVSSGDEPDEPGSKQSRTGDGHDSDATEIDETVEGGDRKYSERMLAAYSIFKEDAVYTVYRFASIVELSKEIASDVLKMTNQMKQVILEIRNYADETNDSALKMLVEQFSGYTHSEAGSGGWWVPPATRDHESFFIDVKELLINGKVDKQARKMFTQDEMSRQYQEWEDERQEDVEQKYDDRFVNSQSALQEKAKTMNVFLRLFRSLLQASSTGNPRNDDTEEASDLLTDIGTASTDLSYIPSAIKDVNEAAGSVLRRYALVIVNATSQSQKFQNSQTTRSALSALSESEERAVTDETNKTKLFLDDMNRLVHREHTNKNLKDDIKELLGYVHTARNIKSCDPVVPALQNATLNVQRVSRLLNLMMGTLSLVTLKNILSGNASIEATETPASRTFHSVAPFIPEHVYRGFYKPGGESSTSEDSQSQHD
tara:strand:- start:1556 stop:2923 length:1368 start_codon:yes stop_codon:yes gene_type:complete